MSGNEWPPFNGQEGGEMSNIAASFPSSDVRIRKKEEEEVKYQAASLNHAYHQLREHGLVVVTEEFTNQGRKKLASQVSVWDNVHLQHDSAGQCILPPRKGGQLLQGEEEAETKILIETQRFVSIIIDILFLCPDDDDDHNYYDDDDDSCDNDRYDDQDNFEQN